jgi:hypothetical protein
MLRKLLLVMMAVVVSYGLTVFAAYLLYACSKRLSERHMSILVQLVINPFIAVLIGALVGLMSKDRPIATSIVGLAPWTILLLASPYKPNSGSGWASWLFPTLVYLPLAPIAASIAWRQRRNASNKSGLLT